MFDLIMHWEDAARIVTESGYDGWIKFVAEKFPRYHLNSTSVDWYDIGPQFIAKLRGTYGDIIVGWKR